jgi:hypothetical protein
VSPSIPCHCRRKLKSRGAVQTRIASTLWKDHILFFEYSTATTEQVWEPVTSPDGLPGRKTESSSAAQTDLSFWTPVNQAPLRRRESHEG